MSKSAREEVVCGHCGQRSLQVVYLSVNAGRSPALREDILAQRFQRFECPCCQEPFVAESPFVYIDAARRQWIVHHPPSWEPGWRALEADARRIHAQTTTPEHAPAGADDLFVGTHVRVVFGLAALREKVMCFDTNLDDAVLEALKLDLLRSVNGLWFHPDGRPRLEAATSAELTFIAAPPGGGEELLHLAVPRGAIDEVARDPAFADLVAELREGSYVDVGRIMIDDGDDDA